MKITGRIADVGPYVTDVNGHGTCRILEVFALVESEDDSGTFDSMQGFSLPVPYSTPKGDFPAITEGDLITIEIKTQKRT